MILKKVILAVAAMTFTLCAQAQSDLILYDFNAIGQSLSVNPATPQQSKVWVALPALSGLGFGYSNNAFSAVDIFEAGTNINDNLAEVTAGLGDNSQINTFTEIDLIGVGFKAGKGFWTVGSSYNYSFNMNLPVELMTVLFGNDANTTLTNFSLEDFNIETTSRLNFYLGYQHKLLDEKLVIGGRFKYIFGQGQVITERTNISVQNDSVFSATVTADALVRATGVNSAQDLDFADLSTVTGFVLGNNTGFGVDLGAHYTLNDSWSFSASAIDIGSITWQDDVTEYISSGTFEYNGVDVDLSDDNPGSGLETIADSLVDAFNFQDTAGSAYSSPLNSRYFASATYNLTKKHSFSAIYQGQSLNTGFINSFGVNYMGKIARGFQVKVGYSIINGIPNNVGLGLQFKAGPIQLYLLSENALGFADYTALQATSVRFGLNVALFGKKPKKKPKQDNVPAEAPPAKN